MKVKELIEKLKELDQEKEIYVSDFENGPEEPKIKLSYDKKDYYL